MRILLTGGAGFIGSSLTDKVLKKGYEVVILDNLNPYYKLEYKRVNIKPFLNNKNFSFVHGDITDKNLLKSIFAKNMFDKVIHLAASVGVRNSLEHHAEYRHNNVEGTKNILDMVGIYGIKHFLFASSSSIYGNNSPTPFKEDRVVESKLNPYAQTKKEGEDLCRNHKKLYGTNITIFRLFTVYGPKGRPDMAPYIFTESILKGKIIKIYGDGSSQRDFTYIQDVISGFLAGIEKPLPYEVFNLGSSSPINLLSFIRIIEGITGKKAKIEFGQRFLPEMRNTYANINKAINLLGYKPEMDLNEGLKNFIQWFTANRF